MNYINIAYVISAICFIFGIKMLSHPKTARKGNAIATLGMLVAILATLYAGELLDFKMIGTGVLIGAIIGSIAARKVEMTQMPQLVAIFNGFGGGASALVASAEFYSNFSANPSTFMLITIVLSVLIGTLTLTGSFIAFGKLQGFISGQPIVYPGQQLINAIFVLILLAFTFLLIQLPTELNYFYGILILAAILGITLTIPIGGADMPVVISLLNSYSGVAAAATGFVLMNNALIISGALVGASGLILTQIMCKGMNRSLANVIFGAVGGDKENSNGKSQELNIKVILQKKLQ